MISGFERITNSGNVVTFHQTPMKVPLPFSSEVDPTSARRPSEQESRDLLQCRLENARLAYENALLNYQMQQGWQVAHEPSRGKPLSPIQPRQGALWLQPLPFRPPPGLEDVVMPTKGSAKKLTAQSEKRSIAHEDASTSDGSSAPSSAGSDAGDTTQTTKMMRNIPNDYTRKMLLDLMDSYGFSGKYNFVYLPMDFKSGCNLGYAFINLVCEEHADALQDALHGFSDWCVPSEKVCELSWSIVVRGLDAHIERYRNSSVMHADVQDDFKPVLFADGKRVPFPKPNRKIHNPQVRSRR